MELEYSNKVFLYNWCGSIHSPFSELLFWPRNNIVFFLRSSLLDLQLYLPDLQSGNFLFSSVTTTVRPSRLAQLSGVPHLPCFRRRSVQTILFCTSEVIVSIPSLPLTLDHPQAYSILSFLDTSCLVSSPWSLLVYFVRFYDLSGI